MSDVIVGCFFSVQTFEENNQAYQFEVYSTGVLPSPCFSIFLARTTSCPCFLAGGKNPGQDAIFEDFVFYSSNY